MNYYYQKLSGLILDPELINQYMVGFIRNTWLYEVG